MLTQVELGKKAKKQLNSVPRHILNKLESWIRAVELEGVEQVRKISGYHDEALQGKRKGQRSIRLSRSYRAVYIMLKSGVVEYINIEEVHKHEY